MAKKLRKLGPEIYKRLVSSPNLTFLGLSLYASLSLISMATMSIGAAILVACVLFERGGPIKFWAELKEAWASPWLKTYTLISLALISACFLSLASARWYPLTFGGKAVIVHWMRDLGKIWYFFFPLFLLIAWRRMSWVRRSQVLRVWVMTFGVLSLVGVQQYFTGLPRPLPNVLIEGYFLTSLFFGHHLSVASVWIFPFFAVLEIAFKPEAREKLGISSGWLGVFLLAGLFTLIFTYSRTLWVALPIGLGIWILGRLPRKTAFGAVLGIILLTASLSQVSVFQRRVLNRMGIDDRVELWKANLEFFQERPVFGVGFGKNHQIAANYFEWLHPERKTFFVGHAHNIYLEVLAGLGVFGTLTWLFWVGWVFTALLWVHRRKIEFSFSWGALSAWIIFLLNGLTQVNFWEGKVMHQMMWMVGLIFSWIYRPVR